MQKIKSNDSLVPYFSCTPGAILLFYFDWLLALLARTVEQLLYVGFVK